MALHKGSITPEEFIEELGKYGVKPVIPPESVIYKYVSYETAVKIISNNSLLFSPPSSFNDPFDLTNTLIDKSYTKDKLKRWLEGFGQLPKSQKKHLYKSNRNNPTAIKNMLNVVLDEFKDKAGISCFSKSHNKTLMWSHYADKHAGLCLGFTIIPIGIPNFSLLNVNYLDKIVALNYFDKKQVALLYWLYTKSHIWQYEEEIRAVYTESNGPIKFEKSSLREIYFGLRTTKLQRETVITLLQELGYQVSKLALMKMNSSTFDLVETKLR